MNFEYTFSREPYYTKENGEEFRVWNPIVDPQNMSFLLIDNAIKMIPEPYLKQITFWEELGNINILPKHSPPNVARVAEAFGLKTDATLAIAVINKVPNILNTWKKMSMKSFSNDSTHNNRPKFS